MAPEVRSHALDFITEKHWVTLFFTLEDLRLMLQSTEEHIRNRALAALAELGPKAAPSAKEIRPLLQDGSSRTRELALEALGKMGREAAPRASEIAPLLHDGSPRTRELAMEALGKMGREAAPRASEIAPLLHDGSPRTRELAVEALGKMGLEAAPHAREMVPLLQDAESPVSAAAVKALGSLGRVAAATVVPLLQPLLADTLSAEERAIVNNPPRAADPFGPIIPEVGRAVDKNQLRRLRSCQAVRALGGMGPEGAPQALPLLLPLLQDADGSVQSLAQRAVANLKGANASDWEKTSHLTPDGPDCGTAEIAKITSTLTPPERLKFLLPCLLDPDPANRAAAAAALAEAGLKTKPQIVRALLPRFKSSYNDVRYDAAEIIRQMGEEAAPCVPDLLPLLQDSDPQVQIPAMHALVKMGDATAPVVAQALLPLLKSTDYEVQMVAINTLGWMGPATAPVALPALLPLLQGEDNEMRKRVVIALGNMGAGAAPAIQALLPLLKDPDPEVQHPAAEALGQLGPTAIPLAVPALLAALPTGRSVHDFLLNYHIWLALEHLGREPVPLINAMALARFPKAADDEKDRLRLIMDRWGNLTCDPVWQCAALATALPAPPEKKNEQGTGKEARTETAQEAEQDAQDQPLSLYKINLSRFHLYLWSGHDAALLLSVRWLGRPAADPMPAQGQGLTTAEQQAVLGMLHTLWPHSAPHPALRREMARRIAQVAQSIPPCRRKKWPRC